MSLEDQYKLLVLGYYGVASLDEYELKVYILKDIEEYIISFLELNPINIDYRAKALEFEQNNSMKRKLQDALLVLHKIKAPMEVVLLVKKHLKEIDDREKKREL